MNIAASPDIIWIFDFVKSGAYDQRHPYYFNLFLSIFKSVEYYNFFNIFLSCYYSFLVYKFSNLKFFLAVCVFLLVTNSLVYAQKDIFFFWAFGLSYMLIYTEKPLSWYFLLSVAVAIFLGLIAYPAYGLLCFLTVFLGKRNSFYAILKIFSIIFAFFILSVPSLNAPKNDEVIFNRLVMPYLSDLINISERVGVEIDIPHQVVAQSRPWDCIHEVRREINVINPYGFANIDPILIAGCLRLSSSEYSFPVFEMLDNYWALICKYPLDLIYVKFKRLEQVVVRPGAWWLVKFILGPFAFILGTGLLVFYRNRQSYLLVPIWLHFIFVVMFAPGYDLRYTYPEFIVGVLILMSKKRPAYIAS